MANNNCWPMEWQQFYLTIIILTSGFWWHCMARLPEQECPKECDCHYFRINWVTDCSHSQLANIPTYLDGLSQNVYILNLNNNNITEIETFPEDIKLRSLSLAGNQVAIIRRETFSTLKYLLDLDLSNNKINYIEPDAFVDSVGLITLELQNNQFARIDGPFLISKSLLNLDISNCQIDYLNKFFFTDLPSLNSIDLSDNPIIEIVHGLFDRFVSLYELKLNRCKLKTISSNAFNKLEDLKTLELSNNFLNDTLDWKAILSPLKRLEFLDLRNTGIIQLADNLFDKNIWLHTLLLAENQLKRLDLYKVVGEDLKHLQLLNLSSCNIDNISANSFAKITNLKTLVLSENPIPVVNLSAALSPLINLEKLSLRNCSLTRLPPNNIFNTFTNLKQLDISMNRLNDTFIDLLNPLESLINLDMSYCNLSIISSDTFSKMTSLETLVLSGNRLEKLEPCLFHNLTNLKVLKLNDCWLTSLNETVFHDESTYPDLEELYLSDNPLDIPKEGSFLPRQLKHLKTLDLSRCNITYIPTNALYSFGNITDLFLQGNKLTSDNEISLEFLQNLPYLVKLDLSDNHLKEITPQVFKYNAQLNWLKLSGNPWQCTCFIADMWEWANTVKGDLSILVNAILPQQDHQPKKYQKLNKALQCEYNITSPVDLSKSPKHYTTIMNRTWSRYIRESACDSSRSLVAAKLITQIQPKVFMKVIPTWAWIGGLIFSLMLIGIAAFVVKNTVTDLLSN